MDFSDTVLLRESTKWWIVGAFLFIGTIFLVSRNSSDTTPVTTATTTNNSAAKATQPTSSDAPAQLVCEGANCPDCFQKIESNPNSNFAAFDPFLSAAADDAKANEAVKKN